MGRIGDRATAFQDGVGSILFRLSGYASGRGPAPKVAEGVEKLEQGELSDGTIKVAGGVAETVSWLRATSDGVATVAKAAGASLEHLPQLNGVRFVEAGLGGVVSVARLPGALLQARTEVLKALKQHSKTNTVDAMSAVSSAGATVASAAYGLASAARLHARTITPFVKTRALIAAAEPTFTKAMTRKAATAAMRAALDTTKTQLSTFEAAAARNLALGEASTWAKAGGAIVRGLPLVFTAMSAIGTAAVLKDPRASDKEKYYAKLGFAGSVLSTASVLIPEVVAGTAIGFGTLAAGPVLLATAGMVGAGAWAIGSYMRARAEAERSAPAR